MSTWTYDASNEANLMKIKYERLIEKQFNKANPLFGKMKLKTDFVGKQKDLPVVQSIGGGVGAGSLPTANENKIGLATITTKKNYATVSIDRESMKAARTDEGSFVRFTAFPVKIATQSFNRNIERQITRKSADGTSGNGALVVGNASNANVSGVGSAGDPYVISLTAASTYFPAEIQCLEEGDLVNVNTETADLEVVAITETVSAGYSSATISLVGSSTRLDAIGDSGTPAPFGASDYLFMQGSRANEMVSIGDVLEATSGSLYGISVGRRWQAYKKDASSAALSTDLMNDVVMNLKRQSGECPDLILMHHHQYIKLLNLLEDHKRYNVPSRKGEFSFSALEYMSADGVIPVMTSRFIDSDQVFFLNTNHIELHLRPGGFEWFDEDGTVFLREASDSYEARYGGYGQTFINPHFQGLLDNLQV
jgi:hypothetical protein